LTVRSAALVGTLAVAIAGSAAWIAFRPTMGGDLPAPGPSLRDPTPELALSGLRHSERSVDLPGDVAANARGEVKVDHSDPLHLVRDYHHAVDRNDPEAIAECYAPERRNAVAGMLGMVPRAIEWQKLRYEFADSGPDRASVRVRGTGVRVEGKVRDLDERVKVRKIRGHWYLDDL